MTKKAVSFSPANRLQQLPPYLFAEIDRRKREFLAQGKDVIDLGVGDPDLPTPDFIVEALTQAARDPRNHRYALDEGLPVFRQAIQRWFRKRFGVTLDREKEVLPLIGSKEGIAHLPLAVLNPGEVALVPDPCYPPYRSGTLFAGGEVVSMPLLASNDFLPDLSAIDPNVLKRARLLFLNYPNNPTAAIATKAFFQEVVEFALEHQLLVVQDAAYSEIGYDGYEAPSILEIPGAKDVAVEFHSLSKTYNMTGWRVGFAVGNRDAISYLARVKANIDSGIFQAIQLAATRALEEAETVLPENLRIYQRRRDILIGGLQKLGWEVALPKATFYCFIPVPPGSTSTEFALKFLEELNIVITPGNGFGPHGEGFFRVSLTVADTRLQEALERIKKAHPHPHML